MEIEGKIEEQRKENVILFLLAGAASLIRQKLIVGYHLSPCLWPINQLINPMHELSCVHI
jgi:hypothetical protein